MWTPAGLARVRSAVLGTGIARAGLLRVAASGISPLPATTRAQSGPRPRPPAPLTDAWGKPIADRRQPDNVPDRRQLDNGPPRLRPERTPVERFRNATWKVCGPKGNFDDIDSAWAAYEALGPRPTLDEREFGYAAEAVTKHAVHIIKEGRSWGGPPNGRPQVRTAAQRLRRIIDDAAAVGVGMTPALFMYKVKVSAPQLTTYRACREMLDAFPEHAHRHVAAALVNPASAGNYTAFLRLLHEASSKADLPDSEVIAAYLAMAISRATPSKSEDLEGFPAGPSHAADLAFPTSDGATSAAAPDPVIGTDGDLVAALEEHAASQLGPATLAEFARPGLAPGSTTPLRKLLSLFAYAARPRADGTSLLSNDLVATELACGLVRLGRTDLSRALLQLASRPPHGAAARGRTNAYSLLAAVAQSGETEEFESILAAAPLGFAPGSKLMSRAVASGRQPGAVLRLLAAMVRRGLKVSNAAYRAAVRAAVGSGSGDVVQWLRGVVSAAELNRMPHAADRLRREAITVLATVEEWDAVEAMRKGAAGMDGDLLLRLARAYGMKGDPGAVLDLLRDPVARRIDGGARTFALGSLLAAAVGASRRGQAGATELACALAAAVLDGTPVDPAALPEDLKGSVFATAVAPEPSSWVLERMADLVEHVPADQVGDLTGKVKGYLASKGKGEAEDSDAAGLAKLLRELASQDAAVKRMDGGPSVDAEGADEEPERKQRDEEDG